MAKDTFYFSHDYNARSDRKLVKLLMKHGCTGIGIYWCIVEMLYEESGYLDISEYDRITFELRIDKNVLLSVINDFELFENDGNKFWSNSVLERLKDRMDKSEKARKSILSRWDKQKDTNVIRSNDNRNTRKGKERKGKESKEKDIKTDWRNDFNLFKTEIANEYLNLIRDIQFISELERLNPGIDGKLSLEKTYHYWNSDEGWQRKKKSKSKTLDWKHTFENTIQYNKVQKNTKQSSLFCPKYDENNPPNANF